ncbi:MAG: hypothetical protein U0792_04855 [Gemmataceae bacterium]
MIPIPIVWTEYTVTVQGRVFKRVPCEHCGTEYVYMLERENTGSAICPYSVLGKDGEEQLVSSAEDSVRQYLANDFDAVPCPVCGNYQRFMFPKLYESPFIPGLLAPAAAMLGAGLALVGVISGGWAYLERPNDHALTRLIIAGVGLAVAGVSWFGLRTLESTRVRRFDPNTGDPNPRIEMGRSRAMTRTEFEAKHGRDDSGEAG